MAANWAARIQFQNAFVNALGLDGHKDIKSIVVTFAPSEVATAVVTFEMEDAKLQAVAEVVATYRFANVEEAE